LGGYCDVHSRRPHVRLALILTDHGESMSDHVVAPCEGLTVHLEINVIGVSHALLERCSDRYRVRVEVVAYVSIICSHWCGGHQDLVDHVDYPVGCDHVSGCHRRVADADRSVCHGECGLVAVQHCHGEPVGHCRGLDRTRVDVVGQDVDQCRVLLVGVVGGQVDPSSCEGRIGGSEDRERSVGLQCRHQIRLRQRCH